MLFDCRYSQSSALALLSMSSFKYSDATSFTTTAKAGNHRPTSIALMTGGDGSLHLFVLTSLSEL